MTTKKSKEIAVTTAKEIVSMETLISEAIAQKANVDTMERLFSLFKEVKAEKAKEAFVGALSQFQAKCPIIDKNKDVKNKDGKSVRYSYASIDSIIHQIKPILGECGLSYTTDVTNEVGFLTAVCEITHIMGHSKQSSFKIPIDSEGFMTAPQKYASALTFAKRYALCNALGIFTGEDDYDATDVEAKPEAMSIMSIKGKIGFLLKTLGEKTTDKDITIAAIKRLTQLDPTSEDMKVLEEIKGRLEIRVKEKNDSNA